MNKVISRRVAAGAMALGLAGSALGFGATTAFAATKAKSASGTISSVNAKNDKLVVKVGTKSDIFKATAKTVIDLGGKKSTFAKLKAGDTVIVTYSNSGTTLLASKIAATV